MRTDLVSACPKCRTRTASLAHCPACRAPLVDLRDEAARTHLLDDARRRDTRLLEKIFQESTGKEPRLGCAFAIFAVLSFIGLITFAVGPNLFTVIALAFVGYRVLTAVGKRHAGRELVGRLGQDYLDPLEPNLSVAPLLAPSGDARPSALLAAPERLHARGKVRARTTICHAPLSGAPCVAFRLVGSCGAFFLDDAGGVTFDVVIDGSDDPVAVELGHAVVALPMLEPVVLGAQARPHLDAFLASRGIAFGRLCLAETLLREGDTVEVTGPSEVLVEPGTYREGNYVRTFRGTPDDPVRIAAAKG